MWYRKEEKKERKIMPKGSARTLLGPKLTCCDQWHLLLAFADKIPPGSYTCYTAFFVVQTNITRICVCNKFTHQFSFLAYGKERFVGPFRGEMGPWKHGIWGPWGFGTMGLLGVVSLEPCTFGTI